MIRIHRRSRPRLDGLVGGSTVPAKLSKGSRPARVVLTPEQLENNRLREEIHQEKKRRRADRSRTRTVDIESG